MELYIRSERDQMKKIISKILIVILLISSCIGTINVAPVTVNAATKTNWPKGPSIYGQTGVLIEASTGTVLYDKKCNKKMYPASITKIMTALLTIENCKMDETVTFSDATIHSIQYGDANMGCSVGEKMTVKDCLYALMLQSANEVATALGEHIAGSTKNFAEMMNKRAKEAGALNTHFANANGLHDPNHYVTAYDMAMITRAASKYSVFNDIVNTTTYTIKHNNKRKTDATAIQRHKMVWPTSGYYYDGIIGGKTGFTDQSGTTLVTYAKRNGMTLIAVVLHSNGTNVYKDTKELLDYGFNNFGLQNVSNNDKRFDSDNKVTLQSPFCNTTDSIYIDKTSNIVLPKTAKFSQLTSDVKFNYTKDSFATITYKYGDKSVGTAKVVYSSDSGKTDSTATVASTTASQQTTTVANNTGNNKNSKTAVEKNNSGKDSSNKESSTTVSNKNSKKSSFKLPGFFVHLVVVIIIIAVVILVLILTNRRLNQIRASKRNRRY